MRYLVGIVTNGFVDEALWVLKICTVYSSDNTESRLNTITQSYSISNILTEADAKGRIIGLDKKYLRKYQLMPRKNLDKYLAVDDRELCNLYTVIDVKGAVFTLLTGFGNVVRTDAPSVSAMWKVQGARFTNIDFNKAGTNFTIQMNK